MRSILVVVMALAVGVGAAPASASIIIDAFTDPFPANPDVSYTYHGLYTGYLETIPHTSDMASQTGLASVIGGARLATLTGSATNDVEVICNGSGRLDYSTTWYLSVLELTYGADEDLNANLSVTASVFDAIVVPLLLGDLASGPRPVPLSVTVTSGRGTANEASATLTQNLLATGDYVFRFVDFTGVDFSDVDRIVFKFDQNPTTYAVDFRIGPIRADLDPTIPEPVTTALLTVGLGGLLFARRRNRRSQA